MQSTKNVIKKDKTPQEALERARWICSKMERTASDLRRLLYRWGIAERDIQDNIIASLIDDRFIDHERYAAAYVREKSNISHWGPAKIVAGLRAKGVEKPLIDAALSQNTDSRDIAQRLERDLMRKLDIEIRKAKNSYDLRARLFRWAAGRGHDFEMINDILSRILTNNDD